MSSSFFVKNILCWVLIRAAAAAVPANTYDNNHNGTTINLLCDLHDHLSDEDLFTLGMNRSLGDCYIEFKNSGSASCDIRVMGKKKQQQKDNDGSITSTGSQMGIPADFTTTAIGSYHDAGCVTTDSSSRCRYDDPRYLLTKQERESMCTTSLVQNAAAQLRYGIRNGYCTKEICFTNSPTISPSSAPTDTKGHVVTDIQWEDDQADLMSVVQEFRWASASADGTRVFADPRVYDLVNETWQHSFSCPTCSYYRSIFSGDGRLHLYEYDGIVQVYDLSDNNTLLYNMSTPWEFISPDGVGSWRDVPMRTDWPAVAVSSDGKRIVFPCKRSHWDGFGWVENRTAILYRVYEWNGTTYTLLGEHIPIVLSTNIYYPSIRMDASGTSIIVPGDPKRRVRIEYQYNKTSGIWEPLGEPIPYDSYISPDGSRLAVLGEDDIQILQKDNATNQWIEISLVRVNRDDDDPQRSGFEMFDWGNNAGSMFAVADLSERRPGPPTTDPIIGAIYTFEEKECTKGINGMIHHCIFQQLGNALPANFGGAHTYPKRRLLRLSPNGRRILYYNGYLNSDKVIGSFRRSQKNDSGLEDSETATSAVVRGTSSRLHNSLNPDTSEP